MGEQVVELAAGQPAGRAAGLHVHEFGPVGGAPLVALHGVTAHGGRFAALAGGHLPGRRVIAPDLRGHGRSPSEPPWTLERHAADVLAAMDARGVARAQLLGHSYGGVVALHLARVAPERVASMLLVDPAVCVEPAAALANARSAGTPSADRAQALAAQRWDWPGVAEAVVSAEVDEHWEATELGWAPRYCPPAVATAWSEMCRVPPTPPPGVPTVVVRALGAAYVGGEYLARCAGDGSDVEVVDVDCGHMVYLYEPALVADLVEGLAGVGRA